MNEHIEDKPRDGRANNSRPLGTRTLEPSTFIADFRATTGLTQFAVAVEIGAREKTVWSYERNSQIPAKGAKREALERLAKKYGIRIVATSEIPEK